MERAIADRAPTIRIPVHLLEARGRVLRARADMIARGGDAPTAATIAECTRLPREKVERILRMPREPLSFEMPVGSEGESRLGDVIAHEAALLPDEEAARREARERIDDLLETLGERERRVLDLRFGLDGSRGLTLEEIGRALSLTRERIRQIEASALSKLRARCSERRYEPEFGN